MKLKIKCNIYCFHVMTAFKQNKKELLSQNNDDLKKNIIQGDFKDL